MKNKGFSLIELLVAVTILAILAAVGIAAFRGTATNARDAKRKADIDAIAKALEAKYDAERGVYPALQDGDFTTGSRPQQPNGSSYPIPSAEAEYFEICTSLEEDGSEYCRQSSQGQFTATPIPGCAAFNYLQTGQTVNCRVALPISGSSFSVDCGSISLRSGVSTINCGQTYGACVLLGDANFMNESGAWGRGTVGSADCTTWSWQLAPVTMR